MNFRYLEQAIKIAIKNNDGVKKSLHGVVGIRRDGVLVKSHNLKSDCVDGYVHAERRVCAKLGRGGTIYVARALKDGTWADSRPCPLCMAFMKNKNVKKVYYTINKNEYGTIIL